MSQREERVHARSVCNSELVGIQSALSSFIVVVPVLYYILSNYKPHF